MSTTAARGLLVAAILAVIALIVVVTGVTLVGTDGGHYAVVRNGGWFDNQRVRDVIQPSSSKKLEGMFSKVHKYPSSQRYYTISADPGAGDRGGVDVFSSSTSDGQTVGIEGSVQFTFVGTRDALTRFDNAYGTRTYRDPQDPDKAWHVWDTDGDREVGLQSFLDAVFRRQVLDNALRIEIQATKCTDLLPKCAFVTAPVSQAQKGNVQVTSGSVANANLAAIQNKVEAELQRDLDQTLGGHFLQIEGFRIAKAELPPKVDAKINETNAARVGVQKAAFDAQKQVQAAIGDRQANEQKAQGIKALNRAYAKSQQKAAIDAIAALPKGLQTLVVGGQSGLSALVGARK